MKRGLVYQFITGVLLIVVIEGCISTEPVATALPTPSVTFKPTITQSSSPTVTPTVTSTPWPLMHGIAYSPYRDCQSSDTTDQPSLDDVKQDLNIIRGMANGIRTYSSTGINADILAIAGKLGLRVSAGAWLSKDMDANELEIQGLIDIAKKVDLESVIVGNEVLLREDLTEDELLKYIVRVKKAVSVPVTTAEIGDILLQHPKVMAAVDYEMVHLYPFWAGKSIDGAAQSAIDQYHNIQEKSNGKRVVIGETGWPSAGPPNYAAIPSLENQIQYAKEFLTLALSDSVDFFYFDAFDEMWKTEGGVGPFWGLLYVNRNFKSDVQSVMTPYNVTPQPSGGLGGSSITAVPTSSSKGLKEFYIYSTFGASENNFAPDGWMGDRTAMKLNTCWTEGQTWPKSIIQASYTPGENDINGWAGVYWLQPKENWGTIPNAGFNLTSYTQLVFKARAEKSGTQVKFFVGGVSQNDKATPTPLPYPSSITKPIFAQEADPEDGFVNLANSWQEYHIDLTKVDLSNVIDGFGWAAEQARTPKGAIFYLGDIHFVTSEPGPGIIPPLHIYSGKTLRNGLDMGIDSSGHLNNWVENLNGQMKASYPAKQDWGSIFITVGPPSPYGSREGIDMSQYQNISVEMRSETGNPTVFIGVKDKNQYDNGYETVVQVNLSTEWKTYSFDLKDFKRADLTQIYSPIEFVFRGNNNAETTIYFRNIQYLP